MSRLTIILVLVALDACVLRSDAKSASHSAAPTAGQPSVPAGGSTNEGGSPSGATTSGAAAGGTTVPPPHVVGACDSLAAVNVWEDITPPEVDRTYHNGTTEVLVDPINAGTIYVGADGQGVHRSTDCGANWSKVSTGRNGAVLDSGTQWSMAIDYVDPQVLYAGNLYGSDKSLFKSTNGGVDWDSLFPPGSEVATVVDYTFVQEVAIDPTDHLHLVVSFHADCNGTYGDPPVSGKSCMAETKDAGAHWRMFKGPAASWEENARPLVIDDTTWLYVTFEDGSYYTQDSGANWEKIVPSGGSHQMYKAADGMFYLGSLYGTYGSPDGHDWTVIDKSPTGDGMVGDGVHIFTGVANPGDKAPYFVATEGGHASTWTPFTSPALANGPVYLTYESDHRVLYSVNTNSGLWRTVTQ